MKPLKPEIVEMPAMKTAVVVSKGDPNVVGEKVFPAMYRPLFTLKFDPKKAGLEPFGGKLVRGRRPAHSVVSAAGTIDRAKSPSRWSKPFRAAYWEHSHLPTSPATARFH